MAIQEQSTLPALKHAIINRGTNYLKNSTSTDNVLHASKQINYQHRTTAKEIGSGPALPQQINKYGRYANSPPQQVIVQRTNNEQIEFLRHQLAEVAKPKMHVKTPSTEAGNLQQKRNQPVILVDSRGATMSRCEPTVPEARNPITDKSDRYHLSTQKYDYPAYSPYDMTYAKGVNQKNAIMDLEGKVLPRGAFTRDVTPKLLAQDGAFVPYGFDQRVGSNNSKY